MDGVIVDTEPLHRKSIFPNFQRFKDQSFRRILYFSYRNIYQKSTQMIKDEFNLDVLPEEIATSKKKIF